MDLVVLSNSSSETVLASSRLVKRQHASEFSAAMTLMAATKIRCDEMQRLATKAFQDSKLRGWRQGIADAKKETAQQLADLHLAKHSLINQIAPALVDVVVESVLVIIKDADRSELFRSAAVAVSSLLMNARWAQLRVHPEQVCAAEKALATLQSDAFKAPLITVVGDLRCGPFDCIFETDMGTADASLDVQIKSIREAIEAAVRALAESVLTEV